MKPVYFLVALLVCFAANAQKIYDTRLIPDSILKESYVVKRAEEMIVKIKAPDKVISYNRVVYTILDEKAEEYGMLREGYDKLNSINTFEATLYDASGEKIKTAKRSDIKDQSAVSEISLMDDSRVKWFGFFQKSYPYTVEFVTETESKTAFFLPVWSPINDEHMGVVQSSLEVHAPAGYQLRYKELGNSPGAKITTEGSEQVYKWEIRNKTPLLKETWAPSWYNLTPTVLLAPTKFKVEDYEGDMSNWESFGKFVLALNNARGILPDKIKADVAAIISPLSDQRQKIYALYKYLQQNTRYISVQLGIGGLQPFEASYVASKKYGDCKALSNYMVALLKEAGITGYYAFIRAGDSPSGKWLLEDFCRDYFNHAIVCVPNNGDTVWLECTSQVQYPGYMGDFTDNRFALLATPDGGKLVKTPRYGLKENLQLRRINAVVKDDGNMKMTVNTSYQAQQQDNIHGMINALSKDKVLEVLRSYIDLPTYELVSYDYKPQLEKYPVMDEKLEIDVSHYAQVSGKRLFVTPNIMNRSTQKPLADSTRKFPINIIYEYRDVDSAEIEIPNGYTLEALPKSTEIKSVFGAYKTDIRLEGNKLFYRREIERYSGLFEPEKYHEFVTFWNDIYKADRSRVVLIKTTAQN